MELKTLAFLILVAYSATSASALSLEKPGLNDDGLFIEFGPQVEQAIRDLIAGIADPLVIVPPELELAINLTYFAELLAAEGTNLPIRGMLTLWGPAVTRLGSIAPTAKISLNGIVRPIDLYVLLSTPGIGLQADYEIDGLLLGIVPVQGKGALTMDIDGIDLGVDSAFKAKLGGANGTFTRFDYIFGLKRVGINLEGIIGAPDLSEEVNNVINNFLGNIIVPAIVNFEKTNHGALATILTLVLNSLEFVQTLDYATILALLQGGGGGLELALQQATAYVPQVMASLSNVPRSFA